MSKLERFAFWFVACLFPIARTVKHPDEWHYHVMLGAVYFLGTWFSWEKIPKTAIYVLAFLLVGAELIVQAKFSGFDEEWFIKTTAYLVENGFGPFMANYTFLPWLGTQHPFGAIFIAIPFYLLGSVKILSWLAFGLCLWVCFHLDSALKVFRGTCALALCSSMILIRTAGHGGNDLISLLFVLLFYVTYFSKKDLWAGFWAGLGLMTKYFAIVPVGIFFVVDALFQRSNMRRWMKILLVAVVVSSPWWWFFFAHGIYFRQVQSVLTHVVNNPEFVRSGEIGRTFWGFYVPDNVFSLGAPIVALVFLSLFFQARDWFNAKFRIKILWDNPQVKLVMMSVLYTIFFLKIQPTNRYFFPVYVGYGVLVARSLKNPFKSESFALAMYYQFMTVAFYIGRGFSS